MTSNATMLVLGGARSGKSRYAMARAAETGLERALVATARASDDEMRERIARHQCDRDSSWRLTEAPVDLPAALRSLRAPHRIVVVDCLTLWLSNLMEEGADIDARSHELCEELRRDSGPVILVSNEVGDGIVPANRLAREFRDRQGLLNQAVAAACARVTLVCAGLPLELKPARVTPFP
jgi:adenosylcobinamide kinase / adenosylcobinamide-phosphate guanylyltransferase